MWGIAIELTFRRRGKFWCEKFSGDFYKGFRRISSLNYPLWLSNNAKKMVSRSCLLELTVVKIREWKQYTCTSTKLFFHSSKLMVPNRSKPSWLKHLNLTCTCVDLKFCKLDYCHFATERDPLALLQIASVRNNCWPIFARTNQQVVASISHHLYWANCKICCIFHIASIWEEIWVAQLGVSSSTHTCASSRFSPHVFVGSGENYRISLQHVAKEIWG